MGRCDSLVGESGLEANWTNEMGDERGERGEKYSQRGFGDGCVSGRNMNDIRIGGVLRGKEGVDVICAVVDCLTH